MLTGLIIVQNNERTLTPVLDQLTSLADEVVVVDGGSNDRTPEIAKAYKKVRFFERSFDGDFAGQMNYAIDQARGSWILHMDADELLTSTAARWIPILIKFPYLRHYRFPRYWIVEKEGEYYYCVSRLHYPDYQRRLYRNIPSMRYENRKPAIHSVFPKKVRRYGIKVHNIHIYHFHLMRSYSKRENRVEFYDKVSGEKSAINEIYFWERDGVSLVPLPKPWPRILDVG